MSITASTYEVIADLENYVDLYSDISSQPISEFFRYMSEKYDGVEPLTFLVPRILNILTNYSDKGFLIVQAFTLNIAFVLSAVIFIPEYYPIVILLNVTSASYFYQLFLMRQYYSFIFLVPLIYVNSFRWKIGLFALSYTSHSSSVMFSIPVLLAPLSDKRTITKICFYIKKYTQIIINKIVFRKRVQAYNTLDLTGSRITIYGFVILSTILLPTILFIGVSLPAVQNLFPRLVRYVQDPENTVGINTDVWKIMIFDLFFLFSSFACLNFRQASGACLRWSISLVISLFYLIAGITVIPALSRLTFLLSALAGFFYTIPLESGQIKGKLNLLHLLFLAAICTKIIYFYYRIVLGSMRGSPLIWSGDPLGANWLDYLGWFH